MELLIGPQTVVESGYTPPPVDYQKQQSFENLGALAKVISPYGWGNPAYGWANAPSPIFYR